MVAVLQILFLPPPSDIALNYSQWQYIQEEKLDRPLAGVSGLYCPWQINILTCAKMCLRQKCLIAFLP